MRKQPNSSPDVPPRLLEALRADRVVLFAGAGMSRGDAAGTERYLPTWGGLLIELVQRAQRAGQISSKDASALSIAVKDGKYLFVAETIRRKLPRSDFDEALYRIFRDPNIRPIERHRLVTRVPLAGVVTTNYDKLLETAYAEARGFPQPTYTYKSSTSVISALRHGRFFILKAHGDIDDPETIVLSERDYRDLTWRQPGYRSVLSAIFMTKTILFVGASLSDTDVKLVLETVSESFAGGGPTHFALLPALEASESEAEHWREFFGIQLIQYRATKGHPEVDAFLKKLATPRRGG
jgi:hypothetical protein